MRLLLEKRTDATDLRVAVEVDDLPNYPKLSPDDEGCIATLLMIIYPPAGIKWLCLDLCHFQLSFNYASRELIRMQKWH